MNNRFGSPSYLLLLSGSAVTDEKLKKKKARDFAVFLNKQGLRVACQKISPMSNLLTNYLPFCGGGIEGDSRLIRSLQSSVFHT